MKRLLAAVKAHYDAKLKESLANLEVYFTRPAGVGEHSDLQEEIRKWTEIGANAEHCLMFLDERFEADE